MPLLCAHDDIVGLIDLGIAMKSVFKLSLNTIQYILSIQLRAKH